MDKIIHVVLFDDDCAAKVKGVNWFIPFEGDLAQLRNAYPDYQLNVWHGEAEVHEKRCLRTLITILQSMGYSTFDCVGADAKAQLKCIERALQLHVMPEDIYMPGDTVLVLTPMKGLLVKVPHVVTAIKNSNLIEVQRLSPPGMPYCVVKELVSVT